MVGRAVAEMWRRALAVGPQALTDNPGAWGHSHFRYVCRLVVADYSRDAHSAYRAVDLFDCGLPGCAGFVALGRGNAVTDELPISIPRAAKLVGKSANWLRSKIDAGEVPCMRPGGGNCQRRVMPSDVLKLACPERGAPVVLVYPNHTLRRSIHA